MNIRLFIQLFLLVSLLAALPPAKAQVTSYQYPVEARISSFYSISVSQNEKVHNPSVLVSECPDGPFSDHKIWITEQDRSMSFTNFNFEGSSVQVTVTKLWGSKANNVIIAPKRYGIIIDYFDGHTVKFTLDKPEYVSVRFVCDDNTDEFNNIKNGLMVFADKPEIDIPNINDKGVSVYGKNCDLLNAEVIYFKPGVYNLFDLLPNGMLNLHDNQSMYIAGGAYVYGTVNGSASVNARIFGRGVISGFKHEFHYDGMSQNIEMDPSSHRINTKRGRNHTIEGVSLLESVNHTLVVPENSLVKDTKFISWACNNDGLRSGDGTVVDHVFMKLCDDYFYGTSSATIKRSVFWPMFNGGTIQLGWGNGFCDNGARFLNNDIINPEWDWIGANTGFIASQCEPDAQISNIVIEDLHITGNINALAALDFAPGDRAYNYSGFIKDITFKNIELDGQQIWWSPKGWDDYERVEVQLSRDYSTNKDNPARGGKSIIKGVQGPDGKVVYVENITFENVKMNGEWVTDKNYKKYFDVDSLTTRNIKFIYDPSLSFNERAPYTSTADYAMQGIGFLQKQRIDASAIKNGWLSKGNKANWNIDLPQQGNYEIRYSVMPIYGDVKFNLKAGKNNIPIVIDIPRNNAFGNIKRVCEGYYALSAGKQTLSLQITEGTCYPDLIEIVSDAEERGTPEYYVHTYWHGVLRKTKSNWKSSSLAFAVTDSVLYIKNRGRFGNDMSLRNFTADVSTNKEKNSVQIFDYSGKMLINEKSEEEIRTISIKNLPSAAYYAVISDGKSYWIAKQFVKF